MGRHRQPKEIWQTNTRPKVLERDGYQCVHCHAQLSESTAHIDHIMPIARRGTNEIGNLRTLCRRCHVLRRDNKHRGMIAAALRDGIIPPNWRELVWD